MPASTPAPILVARQAMATRFEIALHGDHPVALRAAAEEALDEVERLEKQLSLYRPDAEIARLNALAHRQPVRVSPPVFRLLQHAQQLHRETGGAFDITLAPLLRCWGLMGGTGRIPSPDELAKARARVGMNLVSLNPADFTVRFEREGVMLDLGAIGKGYAVEKAAELLRELGVTSALIHGGTSTIYAIGRPPDHDAWNVSLELPDQFVVPPSGGPGQSPSPLTPAPTLNPTLNPTPPSAGRLRVRVGLRGSFMERVPEGRVRGNSDPPTAHAPSALLAIVALRDESLSVSATWGKAFEASGKTYGHVLDPRTGAPTEAALLAAVALPSATETDALSTALLVLGRAGHGQIAALRPGLKTLLAFRDVDGVQVESYGLECSPSTKMPVEKPDRPT